MRSHAFVGSAVLLLTLSGCYGQLREGGSPGLANAISERYGTRAKAKLVDADGDLIGQVIAWQGTRGVLLEIEARGLPSGAHGVHVHSVGTCEDTPDFRASGAHIGKVNGAHGLLHPGGPHRGDLPNLHVHADGSLKAEFFSDLISLAELRDVDGAALIVHEARDDWQTQPIGRAGGRIACAAFDPAPQD